MTDIKKIIEDLEYARYHCTSNKGKDAINDAIDLINRQQAEIERLKAENEKAKNYLAKCFDKYEKTKIAKESLENTVYTARAEAVKEFAERLKEKANYEEIWTGEEEYVFHTVEFDDIDNLVKEIIGEE